ncbi:MAG: radical SAM protein [Peptococcaceae bacterium]|nr:MAG: radical SAM protein [Peptococcaceae bacterium]
MELTELREKLFDNGAIYALKIGRGLVIETADMFLPVRVEKPVKPVKMEKNSLKNEGWVIGISVMSGCPVGCRFCDTAGRYYGSLTVQEMIDQVDFVLNKNRSIDPGSLAEFRISFAQMGEPFYNLGNIRKAMIRLQERFPHAGFVLNTVGVKLPQAVDDLLRLGKEVRNIQLQFSLHTTSEVYRNELLGPVKKLTFKEISSIVDSWRALPNNWKRKVDLYFMMLEGMFFDVDFVTRIFNPKDVQIRLNLSDEQFVRQSGIGGATC